MSSLVKKTWNWTFDRPAEAIWPLLADTVRFNEAAGFPKHTIGETAQDDGSMLFTGSAKVGRFDVKWREEPCNWVANRWFRHRRVFENGPFASLCATLEFSPYGAGCRGDYTLEVEPANLIGRLLLAGGFFRQVGGTINRLADEANAFAKGDRLDVFSFTAPAISPERKTRIDRMITEIEDSGYGHGLARRLADLLLTSQEADIMRLRPLALAHDWQKAERDVVELCLKATLVGLLEVRWDLLCPRCRGAKVTTDSLDRLPSDAHCPSCNIDYDRNFAENIELCFRPAKAVREVADGEFCLFAPMSTPHVAAQVTVPPHECRQITLRLPPGHFRLRSLEPGPEKEVDFPGGLLPEVRLTNQDVGLGDARDDGVVRFVNDTDGPRTIVVEDRRWTEETLTANQVTYFQSFRDLFSDEVLRPGDEVALERVTFLFSDLRGSTALYEEIGEAAAYQLVRRHFSFMTRIIRDQGGAVVKTIGDAVMAAFPQPAAAVQAALEIQQEVETFNAETGTSHLMIKLGVHDGPCIVVTLNGRLDYFGSTVNKAARLQGCSDGGDIVVSETAAQDPQVARLLIGRDTSLETARLKGFDAPVGFTRICQVQRLDTANEA